MDEKDERKKKEVGFHFSSGQTSIWKEMERNIDCSYYHWIIIKFHPLNEVHIFTLTFQMILST